MCQTNKNNIQYFVIITEQVKKNKMLSLLSENDAHGIDVVYAHGSINSNIIDQAFGLETRSKKIVISCLLKTDNVKNLIEILIKNYKFGKPSTGIAFSITVEKIGF